MLKGETMTKLKPCPFCGGTVLELIEPATLQPAYYVACEKCDASGPMAKSQWGASRLWNTRPGEEEND